MAGYYFRLPAITQLTIPQQSALNEPRQIALSGGPGTGKSVVSLWRHISNYERDTPKLSFLLTYTTTLKQYLKACCHIQNISAATNVGTLYRNKPTNNWDEIIVDEAQDMSTDYYHEIIKFGPISYGADDSQILYPEHCSRQVDLNNIFSENINYTLDKNFRNTQRIMQFAKTAFPNANIPIAIIQGLENNIGEKPILLISNGNRYDISNDKQNDAIERIVNSFRADDHNIAVLVPWRKDAQAFEGILKIRKIEHSIFYEDQERFPEGCEDIDNVHITTFKSAKGLEFDTVIIPNFDIITRLPVYTCLWEDLYVACTRAKSNLYLISNYDLPLLNNVVEIEIL